MKPRRPSALLLLQRLLPGVLLAAGLFVQTLSLDMEPARTQAHGLAQTTMGEAELPCHETVDHGVTAPEGSQSGIPQSEQRPSGEPASDPFACCATFACGMTFQALPPELSAEGLAFAAAITRPASRLRPALSQPYPAWRPPAFLL